MAADLPRWLQSCKMEILGSNEWNTVKEDLLARLKDEVERSGIAHLSSLSEEEKTVLLLQVQPAVMQARSYKALLGVTSKMVGSHLLDDVNQSEEQAGAAGAAPSAPKASLIVDRAAAGAAYLLNKWPQTKAACGNLVNSEHMPPQLRRELWRAWLSRPLVASHYESNPPSRSLSMQHQLVSQTSAAVLRGVEPDLSAGDDGAYLRVGPTPGVATALATERERFGAAEQEKQLDLIRKLVSYHVRCEEDAVPTIQHSWQDIEAMCSAAMLLIDVIGEAADGESNVTAPAMAGYFVGFVHQLQEVGLITGIRRAGTAAASLHRKPDYDENEEEAAEWSKISSEIEKLLNREDKELHDAIIAAQKTHSALSTVQGGGGAADAKPPAAAGSSSDSEHWRDFAWTTIRPRMRRLWAGSVTTEAQFFIIDTCLLADTSVAMARIATVDLLCRKELFMGSQHSRRAMQEALNHGAALDRPAIRHAIDNHGFANEMRKVAGVPELASQARECQQSHPPPAVTPRAVPAPEPVPAPTPPRARASTPPPPAAPVVDEAAERAKAEAANRGQEKAATKIESAWRGKRIRKLKIIQRATDTTSIMKKLMTEASSSMRQLSGTPEPGGGCDLINAM